VARADLDRDVRKAEARAKRPAPKKKAAPRGAGIAGVSTRVATRQTTPKQVVTRSSRAGRAPSRPAPVDEIDAINQAYLAGKRKARPEQPKREIKTGGLERLDLLRGDGEGGGLGKFIGNLGGDVIDIATGAPAAAQLLGRGAAAFNPLVGPLRFAPGLDAVDRFQDRVAGDFADAGKATAADYAHRYGPLVRGDFDTAGERIMEHPGLFALDAAGAYSAAGAGVRAAARGGAAVSGSERLARVGSRAITPGSPRYRKPKVREIRMGENSPAVAKLTIPQRPMSDNPLTRPVQRGAGKIRQRVASALEDAADNGNTFAAPFSRDRKFSRAAARTARDYRLSHDMAMHKDLRHAASGLTAAINKLERAGTGDLRTKGKSRWSHEQVDAALWAHAKDLLDVPGKTPRQALDAVVDHMRKGRAENPRRRTTGSDKTIETLQSIPDELLDLKGGPPELRVAVQEYKAISESATEKRVKAGAISAETAQDVRVRPAQSVHAGVTFDRDTGKWTSPKNPYANAAEPPKPIYGEKIEVEKLEGSLAGWHAALRDGLTSEGDLRWAREEISRLGPEGAAKGRVGVPREKVGMTPGRPSQPSSIGSKGVYVPDVPRDPLKKGKAGDPSGAFGRMTQDKVRQSHGTLMRTGNVRMDRGLPLKALERALVDEKHPQFVVDFYKTFAFREANANITKGQRAVMAMEADPEKVVLLSEKSLNDAMRLSKELPDGEMPDSPLRGVELYEGDEGLARAKELGAPDDLIAFPKAAVEGMREGWQKIAGGQIKPFDTVQSLWRRGILAFAPRYYVNSLIGNLGQWMMLTGGDLRTLSQARRKNLGNSVPEHVSGSTNVAEARVGDPRWSSMTLPGKKLARLSDRLMDWQGSFDALYRRAAYIHQVKKGLKAEGTKTRGLSAEDLGEAIRTAPKEVVNQAIRTTELFYGDYLRLGPVERAVFRRAFPFYSFMRFSTRFLMEMPIRHPKRAALLATVSTAAQDVVNPLDPLQDNIANRGMLRFGDKVAQRSTGMNTLFAPADMVRAATSRDPQAVVGSFADQSSPIGLQQILRNNSGTGAFGVPISAPPGYHGSFSEYGGPLMRIDPTTGRPTYYTPTIPLSEQILQTIPLVPQIARGVLSGGDRPYDTTTTLDLFNHRFGGQGDRKDLFREGRARAMEPLPYWGPLLGWAGANLQRYDRDDDIAAIKRSDTYTKKARKSTAKRRKKAKP
jgi:hypothetical protein